MFGSPGARRKTAEFLVREMQRHNGLAPVDLPRFWADQDKAVADPFGKDIPQAPMGNLVTHECVFKELDIPEDWHRICHDSVWRAELCKAYNDKAESIVGRRVLPETIDDPGNTFPPVKELFAIFEAQNIWHNNSYWLQQSAHNEDELKGLLDRVEQRFEHLRDFLFPPNWETEKKRLAARGTKPPLYRGQRGPVTFATSIYGVENLIYLIMDNPELARRFSTLILRAMLERARLMDEEAGYTAATAPHDFGFADDNCYLLTPGMYEFFAFPILKGIFERYAPDPKDRRSQHSDSAMAHILPLLGKLKLNGANFGPTVTVAEIRRHLPDAVIYGQLTPFTYSRNDEVGIVDEFLRDFNLAREKRGLVFTTAGSVNNGSRLTGMRLIMAAIQRYGRYDRLARIIV